MPNENLTTEAVRGSYGPELEWRYEVTARLRTMMTRLELAKLDSFDVQNAIELRLYDSFVNAMGVKYRLIGSA